ncbi:type II secretion system protein [Peribacillus asahii]|uniref:type II secretion system protein n=1 Tax=Peribacillus asahii TaxID=228899 RepID=UPI002079A299|nr:type II secretion system protein [Peribacillus asahii]USK69386.1 type II secretion system GspH family protein [Peribacillus asahii]
MNNFKNNNGFTLIEVLASIAILGIVLTVFLSFFSNSMTFSVKTEDTLTAINLAEKELHDLTNSIEAYCKTENCEEPNNIPEDTYTRSPIELNNKTYLSTMTPLSQNTEESSLGLLPISITIHSEDNKELTTVYGYVELDSDN